MKQEETVAPHEEHDIAPGYPTIDPARIQDPILDAAVRAIAVLGGNVLKARAMDLNIPADVPTGMAKRPVREITIYYQPEGATP